MKKPILETMKDKENKNQFTAKEYDKKLQDLHEIAQEQFKLLIPKPSYDRRKGYYLNGVLIENYENLGYTIESILNVCIMALDGYDDDNRKRDIREAHKQFADVLELTKKLIPHEEFEFLDVSRRLLLENE